MSIDIIVEQLQQYHDEGVLKVFLLQNMIVRLLYGIDITMIVKYNNIAMDSNAMSISKNNLFVVVIVTTSFSFIYYMNQYYLHII